MPCIWCSKGLQLELLFMLVVSLPKGLAAGSLFGGRPGQEVRLLPGDGSGTCEESFRLLYRNRSSSYIEFIQGI